MTLFRDIIDRAIILALAVTFAWRMVHDAMVNGHGYNYLVLIGELLVIGLVLISRPAKEISGRWQDWAIGLAGTCAPMLLMPAETSLPGAAFFVALATLSICLQLVGKASLFRSFGVVAANRGVVTRGLYRVVRHPIYASYCIAHIAFLGLNPSVWNLAIIFACWIFHIGRIAAEERILGADPAYAVYRERVRWRLLPGVY